MSLFKTPGAYVNEVDNTGAIVPVITEPPATFANFNWGPVLLPTPVNGKDDTDLAIKFGKPNDSNAIGYFVASEAILAAGQGYATRVVGAGAYNATNGNAGTGLTVDITAVNGIITAVAPHSGAGGTGYSIGELLTVTGGVTAAKIKVTAIGPLASVATLVVVSGGGGTGYTTGTAQATTQFYPGYFIGDEDDFISLEGSLPDIVARYPGLLGDSLGVSILRASDYYNSVNKSRFAAAPGSTTFFANGDGIQATFTLSAGVVADSGRVLTVNDFPFAYAVSGTVPGTYTLSGNVATIHPGVEDFTGNSETATFTLVNAQALDLGESTVSYKGTYLTKVSSSVATVPYGSYSLDEGSKVVTIGVKNATLSGDGVTSLFKVTTADTLTDAGTVVTVEGVSYTCVTGSPTSGQVQLASVSGGYSFQFATGQTPPAGIGNIVIQWAYPDSTSNAVVVTYGLPNGTNSLKVFANQTSVHVIVYDATGLITGQAGFIIEAYPNLSTVPGTVDASKLPIYYPQCIQQRSNTIYFNGPVAEFGDFVLAGGADGAAASGAEYAAAFNLFAGRSSYDTRFLVDPGIDVNSIDDTTRLALLPIAEARLDCVAFMGAPLYIVLESGAQRVDDLTSHFTNLPSTSYGWYNPNWQWIFDRFNNVNRWIPCHGTDAGKFFEIHNRLGPQYAPAGLTEGVYPRAKRIAYVAPEDESDILYPIGINCVSRDKAVGNFLNGQRSMLRTSSMFNRMNCRFEAIYTEVNVAGVLKYLTFKVNNAKTQGLARNAVNPFLRKTVGDSILFDALFQCDQNNNPPSVQQTLVLNCNLFIKLSPLTEWVNITAEYDNLNVTFSEVVITGSANATNPLAITS